jgi:Tfp pilus assembly protein PilF
VTVEFDLGEAAFREKRYGDATQLFATYVEQRATNPWGHYMLGLSAWKSGNLPQAREAFERTLELDPGHVKSLLNLTRVLLDQELPKEARQRVDVALKLDPASGEAHRLMGRVQTTLKQNEEAIVSYRLALSHDPKDVWSMNNMALILIQQRKYEDALPPLARAVQIDSTIPVVQNNLGIVLEHMGQYTLATNAYRAAIAVDSGYTKAVMSLARVSALKEATTLVPVNLAALGEEFDRVVRTTPVSVAVVKKPAAPPPEK